MPAFRTGGMNPHYYRGASKRLAAVEWDWTRRIENRIARKDWHPSWCSASACALVASEVEFDTGELRRQAVVEIVEWLVAIAEVR